MLKNLTRRPGRSSLTQLAVATAIGSPFAPLGITRGFLDAFEQVYSSHEIDIIVSRQGSADRLGLSAGDRVNLFDEPYLISGVFESRSTRENGAMSLARDHLQSLTDREGEVTYVNVILEPGLNSDAAEDVLLAIGSIDPKLLALTADQFVSTDTRMQVASAIAWMTSLVVLVIGAISTLNSMMTSVLGRTVEIGILRAIGWRRQRIIKMVVLESLAWAFLASLVGTFMAIVGTAAMSQPKSTEGLIQPMIDWVVIAEGIGLALLIGLLGALLPAWRAASLTPTDPFHAFSLARSKKLNPLGFSRQMLITIC